MVLLWSESVLNAATIRCPMPHYSYARRTKDKPCSSHVSSASAYYLLNLWNRVLTMFSFISQIQGIGEFLNT